jgi:acetoacetyl-CoA synthetase
VLYDGSPNYPDIGASWAVAAEAGAQVFCAGAAYMTACEKAGLDLTGDLAQPKLRSIVSTGSPLPTTTWLWLNEQLPDVRIESNSGGTDICTGIVGGSPWRPVWLGEISGRCLGVSAAAFDDTGREVIGEVGELVIREPMPSMPVAFWNDPDGSRYHDAYFDRFKGVWTHGDWIAFTNHGSAIISGRSDATLNRGGVRMGSADMYAIVDVLAGVKDSVVVGIELPDGGYFMPLFVSLDLGYELDDVAQRIHEAIRLKLSPRHVPDVVVAAPAVPRTITGKKLEVPIKRLLSGHLTSDEIAAGSLQDGDALVWYAAYGRENVTPLIEQATRALAG